MFWSPYLSSGLLALLLSLRCCVAFNDTAPWWSEPFGMFQTNLREIDVDMDVEAVADMIKSHGATAWLTSVGGILANYPSELDFHTINPLLSQRESGDLIQDTLDAANARDIRLLARMDFSKVHRPIAEAHPEWLYISPNGTWQNHTAELVSVCPSGDWYQERIFEILEEVMTRYPLDGFFINWAGYNERDYFRVYHGVCHCDNCQEGWREHAGDAELPDGPWSENYAEWRVWSNGNIDAWTARVRDFISERLPGAGLILGQSSDIMFHESNNAIDRDIWHHATAETVSRLKSYRPEVPVLVNSASFLDHAYRITAENPYHFAQYHLQAIARGANPSTYIIGIPGKIPWPGMNLASEIMDFHRRWKDVYTGLEPVAKTALVYPQSSQRDETEYAFSLSEYQGLYNSLQELHIPFDVVAQERIVAITESGGIERYNVLILPDIGELTSEDAEVLDVWVAAGGTVIATGELGVDVDDALQLHSLPATSRVEFLNDTEDLWSMYFAPEQNRTEEHYYDGPIIPLLGTYSLYEWREDSWGLYRKLDYAPFAPPEYIYGNTQIDERGVGIGPYGNGTGVLVPFPVGRGYREQGLTVFRDFVQLILSEVGASEQLQLEISPQVEVTLQSNGERVVVHLMNMSGIRYQNFGQHVPIPAGSIRITGGGDGVIARSLRSNSTLEIEEGEILLPGLDLFDVIVIEGLS
ncbi:hypothetical protein S7711_01572 [Stachybotrys chartarum IBT 7711]|uniref:Beta-galactosidase trimerisation domain-containing protein n=1 Tax=Stachybotrys chartarum (strain CBS 109288 / IBT 7711) TaxID=1280523 RepID=A0A084BC39_STACB|nr:hypothetical protein S7711_01572 [Stachybotrys chartarum IBT 7711]